MKLENEEVLNKFFELIEFMKTCKITTKSVEYKNALKALDNFRLFNIKTARNQIAKNNLLNLKEYIIFQYLREIEELDVNHEVFSFTTILNRLYSNMIIWR